MRRSVFLIVSFSVVLLVAAGAAMAHGIGRGVPVKPFEGAGNGAVAPRVGGETIAQAVVIPGFPYSDTGATCGYANDYDETCPYPGAIAPDVVYAYTPTVTGGVMIDLCSSQYDTKVYVYEGGSGNLLACNDDAGCGYSGYQSRLEMVELTAGITYYIVVDGYGSSCGTYDFQLSWPPIPCMVECPAGALLEGEPDCYDGYVDTYNSGCPNGGWTSIEAQSENCAVLCAKGGTFLHQGLSYRDTDWYTVTGIGTYVVMDCMAEFPVQFVLFAGTDCSDLMYVEHIAQACEVVNWTFNLPAGLEAWVLVGSLNFSGIPCGSDYVLNVCGIAGAAPPVPARTQSWGKIKQTYLR